MNCQLSRLQRTSLQLIAAFCIVAAAVFAALVGGHTGLADTKFGRTIELTGTHSQQQFIAGRSLLLRADVSDNVFAAGRTITVEDGSAESLILAAGTIDLKAGTFKDLVAAGTELRVNGAVEDDVVAAVCPICWWSSSRFELGENGRIGDEATLAAGVIEIKGAIGGNLRAVARRIVVSGTIAGRADLRANEIVIASGANLGGELTARSPSKPQIAADAKIAGPVREITEDYNLPDGDTVLGMLVWGAALFALAIVVGILLLGVAAQLALPGMLQTASDDARFHAWSNIGRGLVWLLLGTALTGLAFASVIGIPIGVVLGSGLVVLCAFAFVVAGYAIGLWLRERRADPIAPISTSGRIGWTLLGLIILLAVNLIPVLGSVIAFIALLAGIGAVAGRIRDQSQIAPQAPDDLNAIANRTA